MNKMIVIIGAVIVIFLGGVFFFANRSEESGQTGENKDASMMESDSSSMQGDDTGTMSVDDQMTTEGGSYVTYSKSALEQASDKRRVLFFYANWCPTCRPSDASFNQNKSKIPEDVTVIRVNYNDSDTDQEEKDLATKYSVTYQHTFVEIDENGNELTKWNGGAIDELLASLK